jgi:Protein of unknown function (DUF3768)
VESERQSNPIAALNDAFRQTTTRDMLITQGVQTFEDVPGLVQAVRDFNDFTPDNDPYGEHDFGAIKWEQQKTFWKIDYYDQELQYWCDPLLPECRRILTVMLASEY